MKEIFSRLGYLIFIAISLVGVVWIWYLFLYCGKGCFLFGTRRVYISGYYFPWWILAMATSLLVPAIIACILRLVQMYFPKNKLLGQGGELRAVSKFSIFIVLITLAAIMPELDMLNEAAKNTINKYHHYKKNPVQQSLRPKSEPSAPRKLKGWLKNYDEAIQQATTQSKPMLIMMTSDWCGWCRKMEQNTLTEKNIEALLEPFVCVQVFEDKAVYNKYKCKGYPWLVFAKSNGEAVHTIPGHMKCNPFMGEIRVVYRKLKLAYPDALIQEYSGG
ncbi:MAG: thioredoxin family protein [Candidatus Hydrogenedentes bacterium]|nr:thioredoxin family protein [Candidatus Hydrogenedentota bacterium]